MSGKTHDRRRLRPWIHRTRQVFRRRFLGGIPAHLPCFEVCGVSAWLPRPARGGCCRVHAVIQTDKPDAVSRLFRVEGHEDQFMARQLSDGSEYIMVVNDPTEEDLRQVFESLSRNLEIHIGSYWWWIRYELP